MPISVQFEAPLGAMAAAAYQSGLGSYLDRQQVMQMQAAQLAQADAHFQQNLQAQLYSQAQHQLANQNAMQFQADQHNQQREDQQAYDSEHRLWQRENQLTDESRERQQQLADIAAQHQWQQQQAQATWDWAWNKQTADNLHQQANNAIAAYVKQAPQMTSVGRTQLASLAGEWGNIQQARTEMNMPPIPYAERVGKFLAKLQSANLDQHIQIPPTVEQRVKNGEIYHEPVYSDPDPVTGEKKELGWHTYSVVTRNGGTQTVARFTPNPALAGSRGTEGKAAPPVEFSPQGFLAWMERNRKMLSLDGAKEIDVAAAQRQYVTEMKAAAELQGKTIDQAHAEMQQGANPAALTPEQQRWQQAAAQYQQIQQAVANAHPPAPQTLAQFAQQVGPQAFQSTGGDVRMTMTPDQLKEAERLANSGHPLTPEQLSFQSQMAGSGQQPPRATWSMPAESEAAAAEAMHGPKEAKRAVQRAREALPRLTTDQEVLSLPPGSLFVWRDGTVRRVPGR